MKAKKTGLCTKNFIKINKLVLFRSIGKRNANRETDNQQNNDNNYRDNNLNLTGQLDKRKVGANLQISPPHFFSESICTFIELLGTVAHVLCL